MKRRKLKAAKITLARTAQIYDLRPDKSVEDFLDVECPLNGETIRLPINPMDPVVYMYKRQIFDGPQREAAEKLRKYTQDSQFGYGAIDTTRDVVDGGKIYDPMSGMVLEAQKQILRAKAGLDQLGRRLRAPMWEIVNLLTLERMFPRHIAEYYGEFGERKTSKYSDLCVKGLEDLAITFTIRS